MVGGTQVKSQTIRALLHFCFLSSFVFPFKCLGALDPGKPLHQFIVQNWQTEQGLPQNSVLSMAQTEDGYLWIGTEEGLARFDGVRFVNFDANNTTLGDNMVRALLVDHKGRLWIGTQSGGLATYKGGKFSAVAPPSDLPSLSVSALKETQSGAIWVGTDE